MKLRCFVDGKVRSTPIQDFKNLDELMDHLMEENFPDIIPASRRTPDALREDQLGGFPETLPPSQAASAEDEKHQQWRNFCVGPDSRKFFGRRMIVLLQKF